MMDKTDKIKLARKISVITGIFCLVVSMLMLLNFLQMKTHKPLESKSLEILVARLSAEPNSHDLMEEIRKLDMLARKAYFSSLWQIKTGGVLLLFGAVVFVIALRKYNNLHFVIDRPSDTSEDKFLNRLLAQRWVGIIGLIIFLMGGISAFFTADYLKKYESSPQKTSSETGQIASIEEITIMTTDSTELATDSVLDESIENADTLVVKSPVITAQSIRQNHNSFRGPFGQGKSFQKGIPTDWDGSTGKNILWKTAIPIHGFNSPVNWGDKLFLTGATSAKKVVYCLNRHNGKILWEREAKNIPGSPATPPKTTDDTGLAAPSVAVDGHSVFAIFGTGDIIALDFNGNQLWARNLGVPKNHYGHSSSLLIWDDKVLVQYDTQAGARVLALDVATGKTVWETKRTSDVSWASPILAEVQGKQQLILLGNPDLAGYDIATGKQLWSVKCMSGEVGPSPAFGGGNVYAANEHARMVAVNPATGKQVWESRHYLPEVASPVYHDGLLYIATTFAVLAAFDATSGELVWEYDAEDQFYSSPVIADGKLYIFDTSGKAYIFNPGRKVDLIASPVLGEGVYTIPAFAAKRMYIRGNKFLYCIGTN